MFQMTENEIYQSYMRAADRKKQITILAQLNACDEDEIKKALVKGGRPLEEIYPPKRKRRTKAEMKADAEKKAAEKKTTKEETQEAAVGQEDVQEALRVAEDENGPILLTGGEGDIDGYMPMKRYRSTKELEDEPEDMTEHEKERLKNIRTIPMPVREIVQAEIGKLTEKIMELEKRHDMLVDYLNGERVS